MSENNKSIAIFYSFYWKESMRWKDNKSIADWNWSEIKVIF